MGFEQTQDMGEIDDTSADVGKNVGINQLFATNDTPTINVPIPGELPGWITSLPPLCQGAICGLADQLHRRIDDPEAQQLFCQAVGAVATTLDDDSELGREKRLALIQFLYTLNDREPMPERARRMADVCQWLQGKMSSCNAVPIQ